MSKKVIVTSRSFGSISQEPMDILTAAGCEVLKMGDPFDMEAFSKEIVDADALIIGAHDFSVELMAQCKNLAIVCKHGAGLDNLHLPESKELGIPVCNVPATNANAVADLALGLMLASARHIALGDRRVRQGHWNTLTGKDVYGKTLGLLGFGAIARNVAKRAAGFSMDVVVYDPFVKEIPADFPHVKLCSDLMDVVANCDFLSAHLPLNDQTRDMIDAPQLAAMRPGSYVINTSRGGIVNEDALYQALASGHLSGAAADVTTQEPMTPEHPLLSLDNFVITPHIGMYSREAIGAVSLICAQNVANAFSGQPLRNQVNL